MDFIKYNMLLPCINMFFPSSWFPPLSEALHKVVRPSVFPFLFLNEKQKPLFPSFVVINTKTHLR